ncbi:MAG TPA: hypothetical protein VHW60_18170 [Caulobacteraceae bacterium]|nr:hypothetical protein [Caulobacteraceae bacterium]
MPIPAPTAPAPTAEFYARAMQAAGEALGFSPPTPAETPEARAAAERLMGHEVASLETIAAIAALQPASTLVFREASVITGVVATLLLKAEAEPTLRAGEFDGLEPADAFLGRPSDPVTLYYLWGIAGSTKVGSTSVMQLSRRLRYDVLADLTSYALAATPVGRHVGVTQLGFAPVRYEGDALLVSLPTARRQAA